MLNSSKSKSKAKASHKGSKSESSSKDKSSKKSQPQPQKEDVMTETSAPETSATETAANPENSSETSDTPTTTEGKKERKPMGTVQERLVEKAEYIKSEATLMLKLAIGRGAPENTVAAVQQLLAEADMSLGAMVALKESEWQPTDKKKTAAPMKTVNKGDKIVILKDYVSKYSYIPGLTEGSISLVAADVQVAGRFTQVLLKAGESVYGWAPRSHVDLAP